MISILTMLSQMSAVGITENAKGDNKKFEIWCNSREEVYIVQVPGGILVFYCRFSEVFSPEKTQNLNKHWTPTKLSPGTFILPLGEQSPSSSAKQLSLRWEDTTFYIVKYGGGEMFSPHPLSSLPSLACFLLVSIYVILCHGWKGFYLECLSPCSM